MPDLGRAPVRISRAQWLAVGALFGAAILFTLANWQFQLRAERRLFESSLEQLGGWSRAELVRNWRDRDDLPAVKWVPADNAEPALAIVPRNARMKRDSVYLLYRGDRPAATLAVTEIGDWWNGAKITNATKVEPRGSANLNEIVRLMGVYRESQKPGSEEIGWTEQAMEVAKGMQ